jgi:hypothetical protein
MSTTKYRDERRLGLRDELRDERRLGLRDELRDERRVARAAGALAVAASTLFGVSLVVVALHPGPNRVDRLADRVARRRFDLSAAHAFIELGSPVVVVSMLLLLSVVGWQTPLRHRALVVTGGGALTCLLTDHVLQRIVQRHRLFGFVDTYPSGHVTGVAVVGLCLVAIVALQRSPWWLVVFAVLLSVVGSTMMTWAVVVSHNHLFTDSIGAVLMAVSGVAMAATVAAGLPGWGSSSIDPERFDHVDNPA